MDLEELLKELFSSQQDWHVKTSENTYVVVPDHNEEIDDEE
ncbi:hypothetical protein ACFQI7_01200 [Paenibacillus allorhizosphaerae]|uniref:Uncharacterized protein n=1 Tax=Paenibacillus allorhizosphaerae TaxID=2849866 RepID=A0ABN7TG05_9BACL|nr:hypothetical protein [Paenibacillus allorhizosphaerae]CAG7615656.1 hypothetical protein PAECIP111802_00196 [Paenibacillus allorhizosphaerae]